LLAVRVQHSAELLNGIEAVEGRSPNNLGREVDVDYIPTWETKKLYICPRGIFVHRGNPDSCGRECRKVGSGNYVNEQVLKILVVKKKVFFNPQLFIEDW
jgi:hypothetical protein